MSLINILIITGIAIILSRIINQKWREWALLTISILLIFWMQPEIPIRFMAFWLPIGTIFITIISWLVTKRDTVSENRDTYITIFVIVVMILAFGVTRYISISSLQIPVYPPRIDQIFIGLLILTGFWFLFCWLTRKNIGIEWLVTGGILALFLFIKVPSLNTSISQLLRIAAGQSRNIDPSIASIKWLGFSYVAFRLIHTIRDRQTGRLPDVSLREYLIYVMFFPAFTAGPIDRIERFIKDLRKPFISSSLEWVIAGERIIMGLFKKFILADTLSLISINNQNVLQVNSTLWLWIMVYAYAFQIYFDFSGYTDIAIGIGNILGFKLPENFNRPYLQRNITQFWNNWHITLTQWFRAYFFFPFTRKLRKSQQPKFSPAVVILISQISTMVLIGMWHGVTMNFFLWGIWQGMGLFIHNQWSGIVKRKGIQFDEKPFIQSVSHGVSIVITFHFITLGWVWFALSDSQVSFQVIKSLLGG